MLVFLDFLINKNKIYKKNTLILNTIKHYLVLISIRIKYIYKKNTTLVHLIPFDPLKKISSFL